MKKVFVLGNGFDLNLGLNTGYSHFLASDEFREFYNFTENFSQYSLGKHLKSINDRSNWVDVEVEIANFSLGQADSYFIRDYRLLCEALKKYLTIQQKLPLFNRSMAKELFLNNYEEDDEFLIVSFNYTNTAELILHSMFESMYGSKPKSFSIKYIHGSVNSNNIIFGVDDSHTIQYGHIEIRKTTYQNFSGEIIRSALFEHSDEIHFFGLSFGETDHMYFKEYFVNYLCKGSNTKRHLFYYYGTEGWNSLHEQFYKLTNGESHKLKMNGRPEFVKVN